MKYVIIALMFYYSCFAQDKMHLTAYRMIDENNDGPCSVKSYVKYHGSEFAHAYVTAESDDPLLIKNLLSIKKHAKQWEGKDFFCPERSVGGEPIPQMIVISGIKNDTIFIDDTNQWIIFPDKNKAYFDKDSMLKNCYTGIIKEFIEYDFRTPIRAQFYINDKDSLSTGAILYRKRSGTAFLNNFTTDPDTYNHIKTDTANGEIKKMYIHGNDSICVYKRQATVIVSDSNTRWDIGDIKPGDTEAKLFKKYPASTKVKLIYLMRFEEIRHMYYYHVLLKDNAGSIAYFIKDKKVEKIRIDLN
jgi:hypothetical protein